MICTSQAKAGASSWMVLWSAIDEKNTEHSPSTKLSRADLPAARVRISAKPSSIQRLMFSICWTCSVVLYSSSVSSPSYPLLFDATGMLWTIENCSRSIHDDGA